MEIDERCSFQITEEKKSYMKLKYISLSRKVNQKEVNAVWFYPYDNLEKRETMETVRHWCLLEIRWEGMRRQNTQDSSNNEAVM